MGNSTQGGLEREMGLNGHNVGAGGGQCPTESPLPSARRGRFWWPKGRGGQALVEFALVLPILLLLLLAVTDFGRAFWTLQVITNSSREGARVGVLAGVSSGQVTTTVNNYLQTAGMDQAATVTVTGVDGAVTGDSTTVAVSYPFQSLTGSFIPGWGGRDPLEPDDRDASRVRRHV